VQAVNQETTVRGGPIPTYGPRKMIDPDKADRLWPQRPGVSVTGSQLAQARAAALVVDVQTKRLTLEQRRGALISRDRATFKAFAFARMLRDRWLAWPARVGPLLAATFDLDAGSVTVAPEGYVREQLSDLASERCEF
jgi:hypothetical protein